MVLQLREETSRTGVSGGDRTGCRASEPHPSSCLYLISSAALWKIPSSRACLCLTWLKAWPATAAFLREDSVEHTQWVLINVAADQGGNHSWKNNKLTKKTLKKKSGHRGSWESRTKHIHMLSTCPGKSREDLSCHSWLILKFWTSRTKVELKLPAYALKAHPNTQSPLAKTGRLTGPRNLRKSLPIHWLTNKLSHEKKKYWFYKINSANLLHKQIPATIINSPTTNPGGVWFLELPHCII